MTDGIAQPMEEGFIPATVGDYACFENQPGVWIFGQVTACTKNPPRVRELLTSQGETKKVGPRNHIRLAPVSKLNAESMATAWREGPSVFNSWEEVREFVVPHKRSQTDG